MRSNRSPSPTACPLTKEKLERLPNAKVISVAPLLANAIRRIHEDQSISDLFKDDPAAV